MSSEIQQESPRATYDSLMSDPETGLVDVRTQAEWQFVGLPDLGAAGKTAALVEWRRYPDMAVNQSFSAALSAAIGDAPVTRLYFLCRSGARSLEAAAAAQAHFAAEGRQVVCVNVAEGFEGDLDQDRRRGRMNGWKAAGLPWRQN